jgi:serine/threonine protein kinase
MFTPLEDIRVKLIDFGLACARNPGSPPSDRLTREKCGTLRYAAPEVFGDTPYAPERADIWSAGVVLYSIIAHRHPYAANNGKDVVQMVANTELKFDGPAFAHVSSGTVDLIRALLSKDPAARPDAKAALADARSILAGLPATSGGHPIVGGPDLETPSACAMEDHRADCALQPSCLSVSPGMGDESVSGRGKCKRLAAESTTDAREPRAVLLCAPSPLTRSGGGPLDAITSNVSTDPGKSNGRLPAPPDEGGDSPPPAPFNLGNVVRGIFDVFNRAGSPTGRRDGRDDTAVLDESDSETDDSSESSDIGSAEWPGSMECSANDDCSTEG